MGSSGGGNDASKKKQTTTSAKKAMKAFVTDPAVQTNDGLICRFQRIMCQQEGSQSQSQSEDSGNGNAADSTNHSPSVKAAVELLSSDHNSSGSNVSLSLPPADKKTRV
jgi:hypothetical protein